MVNVPKSLSGCSVSILPVLPRYGVSCTILIVMRLYKVRTEALPEPPYPKGTPLEEMFLKKPDSALMEIMPGFMQR